MQLSNLPGALQAYSAELGKIFPDTWAEVGVPSQSPRARYGQGLVYPDAVTAAAAVSGGAVTAVPLA